jgi:hypothetical protein
MTNLGRSPLYSSSSHPTSCCRTVECLSDDYGLPQRIPYPLDLQIANAIVRPKFDGGDDGKVRFYLESFSQNSIEHRDHSAADIATAYQMLCQEYEHSALCPLPSCWQQSMDSVFGATPPTQP